MDDDLEAARESVLRAYPGARSLRVSDEGRVWYWIVSGTGYTLAAAVDERKAWLDSAKLVAGLFREMGQVG